MKHLILISIFISLFISGFSQTEATTEDGKKVLLFENGTWQYSMEGAEIVQKQAKSEYDCSSLISTEIDKVTRKKSTFSKDLLLVSKDGNKYGFGFYFIKTDAGLIVSIKAVGSGNCIDEDNEINILLRDGSRLKFVNDGKFNCEAKATLYFGGVFGKKSELEDLATKEIETVRVWTEKGYVEMDFNSLQSKEFLQTVSCLIN
jgi:hypothetical protein